MHRVSNQSDSAIRDATCASPRGQGPCRGCCRQTGPHPRPRPPRTTVPGRDPRVTRLRSRAGTLGVPVCTLHSHTPGRSHTAPGSRGPPPAHCGTRHTEASERADARTDAHRYVALSRASLAHVHVWPTGVTRSCHGVCAGVLLSTNWRGYWVSWDAVTGEGERGLCESLKARRESPSASRLSLWRCGPHVLGDAAWPGGLRRRPACARPATYTGHSSREQILSHTGLR